MRKCITFDQEAQDALPDHIKAKMKADRDNASIRQQLIAAGRSDLVEALEISISGWAGIMPGTGMIVDRRKFPEAIPAQGNELLGLPQPKKLPINTAYDYESTEEFCDLLGQRGLSVCRINEGEVTAGRARELIFEHNKRITG